MKAIFLTGPPHFGDSKGAPRKGHPVREAQLGFKGGVLKGGLSPL